MSLRTFLALIILLGVAGGGAAFGYVWINGAEERRAAEAQAERRQTIQLALGAYLEALETQTLRSVVPGIEVAPGVWDFRAAARRGDEVTSPAHGQAALHCDTAFERAECWTLIRLDVDGGPRLRLDEAALEDVMARTVAQHALKGTEPAETSPAETSPAPTDAAEITPESENEQAEQPAQDPAERSEPEQHQATPGRADDEPQDAAATAAEPSAAPAEESAVPPAQETAQNAADENAADENAADEKGADLGAMEPAAEATPQEEGEEAVAETPEAPSATHLIRVSEVNARDKPGKSGRVLAILSSGQALERLGGRGSWGFYRVIGGEEDGLEVWIYSRLLKPVA